MQIWPAPAKLNLFLHVTGRRDDGYHLLQTAFQFLDFADELTFEPGNDGQIQRESAVAGVDQDSDLSVRAARLLQSHTGCHQGARIRIKKNIPIGGGLGGGSSDGATTLMALNRLWELDLPEQELAKLGLSLGADVPVFIGGHAAWAEGVGEQLDPIDPPENWYLILMPPVSISTAEIFQAPELTRNSPPITIRDFHEGRGRNDLEPVVRKRFPEVDRAMNWLAEFGSPRMTGTGACVFIPVASRQAGLEILDKQPPAQTGFVAQGVNTHPVVSILKGNP
jgi:4-diphosphocytidyl-2-C-methyl-D-erythritol kinase